MKWGVRKDKTIKKINTMYNRSNMWTNRKIGKLEKKGKTNKAKVMRYMRDTNEKDRKRITNKLSKMSDEEFKKTKGQDFRDTLANTHKYKDTSFATLTTPMSRLSQYDVQRGMRWMSNFTFERTLSRMDAKQGYDYLNRKYMDWDARLNTYRLDGNPIY